MNIIKQIFTTPEPGRDRLHLDELERNFPDAVQRIQECPNDGAALRLLDELMEQVENSDLDEKRLLSLLEWLCAVADCCYQSEWAGWRHS